MAQPSGLASQSWPPVPQRVSAHGHCAHGLIAVAQAESCLSAGVGVTAVLQIIHSRPSLEPLLSEGREADEFIAWHLWAIVQC